MSSEHLFERVRWLIADETGYPADRITMETRLQADMGVAGDDGEDLLVRFQKEFGVNMSELRYDEHFDAEGVPIGCGLTFCLAVFTSTLLWWLIPFWAAALFLYWRRLERKTRDGEIRVSDLVRSAETGQWDYRYVTDAKSRS